MSVLTSSLALLQTTARQLRLSALASALAALPAAFALLALMPTSVLSGLVLLMILIYAGRKIGQGLRAARLLRQLRMEAQFVEHGPPPAQLPSCLRRRDHLWTRSLTLHGLEAVLTRPDTGPERMADKQARITRQYERAFTPLAPPRWALDLAALFGTLVLWLLAVPEAAPLGLLGGLAVVTVLLALEVTQAVLRAGLRDGLDRLASVLMTWTLAQKFEEALRQERQKRYHHTLIYRAALPALWPIPLREVA